MAFTNREASIVFGMVARGDKDHDIAAWFGENQGRIAEVKGGSHGTVSAAPTSELPPKGAPGPKGKRLRGSVTKAIKFLEDGENDKALDCLRTGLVSYNSNEA